MASESKTEIVKLGKEQIKILLKWLPRGYAKIIATNLDCELSKIYRVARGEIFCTKTLEKLIELAKIEKSRRNTINDEIKMLNE